MINMTFCVLKINIWGLWRFVNMYEFWMFKRCGDMMKQDKEMKQVLGGQEWINVPKKYKNFWTRNFHDYHEKQDFLGPENQYLMTLKIYEHVWFLNI